MCGRPCACTGAFARCRHHATCPEHSAGKIRTPATKTLYSVLRCTDVAFMDLLDACLRSVFVCTLTIASCRCMRVCVCVCARARARV